MSSICPIPQRLKEARISKEFSQQKLGELLGLEAGNASARMNQYERGKHTPDFDTLKRIAEALDVPVAYFYCEDELDAKIVAAMHHLDPDKKQVLLEYLQQIKFL